MFLNTPLWAALETGAECREILLKKFILESAQLTLLNEATHT